MRTPKAKIRHLYESGDRDSVLFRYGLIAFDLVSIAYIIGTSFLERGPVIVAFDILFGALILLDFGLRFWIEERKLRFFASFSTAADVIAIVSFLAPLAGENLGFLRIVRTLRLLRTYQMIRRLRHDVPAFRRHETEAMATINLVVFIFITTGLVYVTQRGTNPGIETYVDSLYFTMTTLTTTGFGDITLEGTEGRLISVIIMFFGVSLFLRLAQVLFRPNKVHMECARCGLTLHDADAVHCKHCGRTIHIETEGQT